MKLLVLYEELAGYFMACISEFAEQHAAEVLILRKEVNAVAPFHFKESARVKLLDRSSFTENELLALAVAFSPDAVFCAGWGYKPYLKVCRHFRQKLPVVLGFDNWWEGSLKQRISVLLARFYFAKCFNRCFVPGAPQKIFAKHLGFKEKQIATGAYSCDFPQFHSYFEKYKAAKADSFPKRFIYAGRYSPEKGIEQLWQAFIQVQEKTPNDWELWCLGKGNIAPVVHPKIRHVGFVQPEEMETFIRETGVFILPSIFEPWGVVAHEFAAAGFPLLLSEKVAAAEAFLEASKNGFSFQPANVAAIAEVLEKVMQLSDQQLVQMGESSAEKAAFITPAKWSETLFALIHSR